MASGLVGVFEDDLSGKIQNSKILVVGAGGIGCELLKNLVLTGFNNIEIIDLDTIDVTNLNRQFLFQKVHVGKSKSRVARESALRFNPNVDIKSYHDSVLNPDYGVNFYKNFALVLNALDNRTARNHVNRMCLAADIPLVESGTAGYLGQVTVIKKGETECYECTPKPRQKTFPGCTIRNTPSEPIHCIVWSKHLFNQLFGESDPDEDVSPDTEDPEAAGDSAGEKALQKEAKEDGNVNRTSTRQWAQDHDYNPKKIFQKLFHDDVKYLLSMDKLWAKRRPPVPLDWDNLPDQKEHSNEGAIKDQKLWTIKECVKYLETSINTLKDNLKALNKEDHLVWDKDDEAAMDFVTACANIRMHIFNITQKTRFDVKSMAGNIIPAIATTNAIIAGGIVMEAIKILNGDFENCKTIYLTRKPNPRKKILVPCQLIKPNPKCYVCSEKPEVSVKLNMETMTIKNFEERVLKSALNMVAPDAEIEGRGLILISSEAGETECNNDKTLKSFDLNDGAILSVDDFMQEYNLKVFLYHSDKLEDGVDYELVGDLKDLKEKAESTSKEDDKKMTSQKQEEDDDDDIIMVVKDGGNDRKRSKEQEKDDDKGEPMKKKLKSSVSDSTANDEITIID